MARNIEPIFGGGGFGGDPLGGAGGVVSVTGVTGFDPTRPNPGGSNTRPPSPFTPAIPGGDKPTGGLETAPVDPSYTPAQLPKDAPPAAEKGDSPSWMRWAVIIAAGVAVVYLVREA